jgi:hypothetical protein
MPLWIETRWGKPGRGLLGKRREKNPAEVTS